MFIVYAMNFRDSYECGWMPQDVYEDIIWTRIRCNESIWLVPGMYFE